MLKELISTKINEVFLEYQKANNIVSGDIDPFDAHYLDRLEAQLEQLIERVCSYQEKQKPALYIYRDSEGIAHSVNYEHIDKDKFFYEVSHRIAFDDCTDETVVAIFWEGKEVEYAGWQRGMKFEYKDTDGNTIWVCHFPQWDH